MRSALAVSIRTPYSRNITAPHAKLTLLLLLAPALVWLIGLIVIPHVELAILSLRARVAPRVLERLDPDVAGPPQTRAELAARFGLDERDLALFEEMGLIGGAHGYSPADLELCSAFQRAQQAGVTRERFPAEGMGHYVELLGELARREVRSFTHWTHDVPAAELEELALGAIAVSEPIIALIRRKLILRALRDELERSKPEGDEES